MIAGPGALTMVMILMQDADSIPFHSIPARLGIIASILTVLLLTTLILIGGRKLMSVLGPSGSKVMMRLMGLIVMLIAAEFFFAGITPYIQEIVRVVSS